MISVLVWALVLNLIALVKSTDLCRDNCTMALCALFKRACLVTCVHVKTRFLRVSPILTLNLLTLVRLYGWRSFLPTDWNLSEIMKPIYGNLTLSILTGLAYKGCGETLNWDNALLYLNICFQVIQLFFWLKLFVPRQWSSQGFINGRRNAR